MKGALLAWAPALLLASSVAAADPAPAARRPPAAAPAAARPSYAIGSDGTLVVSALPDVLARPEVRPHLTTGLTTSFLLAVTASGPAGPRTRGAARVDVRWEPWDEVFLVAAVGADGRVRRESLPTFDRLAAWWRALALPVALAVPAARSQVRVELSVVPFSQSEQRDAQRWFSGALGPETAGEPPAGSSEGASRLDGVVDLLFATSIQRRSVVRYEWLAAAR